MTVQEVLDAIDGTHEATLAWGNELRGAKGADGVVAALFDANVATDDGRIAAAWGMVADAYIEPDGSLTEIRVSHTESAIDGIAPERFEAETGISGVQSDVALLGFQFEYVIDDGAASGDLSISEVMAPVCGESDQQHEDAESGSGMSSGGCSGTQFEPIETATLDLVQR